jgi:hypothetical protein
MMHGRTENTATGFYQIDLLSCVVSDCFKFARLNVQVIDEPFFLAALSAQVYRRLKRASLHKKLLIINQLGML